ARFEELGFPSVKDEEWKYTNVAPIAKAAFTPLTATEAATSTSKEGEYAAFDVVEARDSQLVFVNGRLRNDLSRLTALPEGFVVLDLSAALADERYAEIARAHLTRHADYVANGFTALNTALVDQGAFVYIPK